MERRTDHVARLINKRSWHSQQQGIRYFRKATSLPGVEGMKLALDIAEGIPNEDLKSRMQSEIVNLYTGQCEAHECEKRIANFFSFRAIVRVDQQLLCYRYIAHRWARSQSLLLNRMKISEQEVHQEVQNEPDPTTSENYQDKPQRAIDLLLHRITPANAPSALRAVRAGALQAAHFHNYSSVIWHLLIRNRAA